MNRVEVGAAENTEVDKLWLLYKKNNDIEAKNELLLHYVHLVKKLVRRMMPKYNSYNEYDDLVNCGIIGLIDAVEKFDLKHGVKFETYAITRIRGEILDYMRAQDWAPSSLRKKINAITGAYDSLERETGLQPSEQSVASELNMPVAQVQKVLAQTHIFNLVNFEDTLSAGFTAKEIPVPEEETPESILLGKEMKEILTDLIEKLPEKERLVITLYYYEELMLKEIAEILNVSESRVSQIHSKVLAKMRMRLADGGQ
ncbi:MAG: FliA/WhiG family RNA polymerase sigma factor [Oscillospiraceae bacterium]|jgi:RNA polymerase sigma factor for flagellar operon FliA|nr:FliA/WhiG family RNA polymerase sigma factor [Oscillospiraceae bacterium]